MAEKMKKVDLPNFLIMLIASIGAFWHLPALGGYDIVDMLFGWINPVVPMIVQFLAGIFGFIGIIYIGMLVYNKRVKI